MKKIFYLLLVFLLCVQSYIECKRTISGGGSRSSSSSSSSRRTSSNTYSKPSNTYSSSHSASRPAISHATSRPAISHATSRPVSHATSRPVARPNQDNSRLSYQPSAPVQSSTINRNHAPPPYSPVNNPSSISRNQAPPPYSPRAAPGHNTIQASNYPRQTYHQPGNLPQGATLYSGPPVGVRPSYHQPGHVPAGATMYQPGHVPAGATMYGGGHHPPPPPMYGGGYHAPPTYYAPNQLPPGAVLYSQPPKSSGPGLGTGLVAGAIGGAILGHVLTPTHHHHSSDYHRTSNYAPPPQSTADNDKIIIINNGPPGSVTTTGTGSGTTVIENNPGVAHAAPAAVSPGNPAPYSVPMQSQDPPTPLAPFPPYQPGTTQEGQYSNSNNNAGTPPVAAPVAGATSSGIAMSEPGAANAPMSSNDTNAQQEQGPPPGTIACYPILVNQTDPNDPTKEIQVEQIACYEVPANPPVPANQQQSPEQLPQQPPLAPQPPQQPEFNVRTTEEHLTQKTSTVQLAESSQIKEEEQKPKDDSVPELDGQNNQEIFESTKLAEALDYLNKAVEIFKKIDKDQERSNLTAENIWKSVTYYKQMQAEKNNNIQ